jgi:hypothetical protein
MSSTQLDLQTPSLDDLPRLTAFFAEIQAEHGVGLTEGQIRDQLTSRHANVAENYRMATAPDGRVIGWVAVWYPE